MSKIIIDNRAYHIHPIYNLYAASKDGNVIHIVKRVPHSGTKNGGGYMNVMVRKHGESGQKRYYVHRFVWESFNGEIPAGLEIDHINNDGCDNRLSNLQLLTPKQNCKKSAENRDYKLANYRKNKKCVKATNCD